MEENINGFTETTSVPEGAPSEAQGSYTSPELDVERIDNVSQLRDHVKGLKSDLETYKSTHNFVSETFGDLENAKLAQQLYSGFVSEDFEPDEFYSIINEVSPTRTKALIEKFAQKEAMPMAYEKVKELFGSEVTPEEVSLFRQWRDSGYMITEEDDIPDAFKYDSYGNPLSEDQVNVFKEQFQMLNNLRSQIENQVTATQQREEQERLEQIEMQRQEKINNFDLTNLKVLENDLQKVGLDLRDSDTPELRQQKEFVREFIVGGVGRMFLGNPQLAKDYQTALAHLSAGEDRLARRYEPRIQKGLLDILRSEPISRLLSSLTPSVPRQARPEISSSGMPAPSGQPADNREERIRNLMSSGVIQL